MRISVSCKNGTIISPNCLMNCSPIISRRIIQMCMQIPLNFTWITSIPFGLAPCPQVQVYDKPIMLYGPGEFQSDARGKHNVPHKYIKDRCKNYFDYHVINKFLTLQICHHCKHHWLYESLVKYLNYKNNF